MAYRLSSRGQVPHDKHDNTITVSAVQKALRKHRLTPPSSEREDRASFASFKEDRAAIAQSFIDSKVSSYARNLSDSEEAIDDSSSNSEFDTTSPPTERATKVFPARDCCDSSPSRLMASLAIPDQLYGGFVCPCDGFKGWKQINVGGRMASKSYSDLRVLNKGFTWELTPKSKPLLKKPSSEREAGHAPLETLPMELLREIIDQLVTDIPPNGYQPRNIDLMSLLLTSRAMHSVTLATLYSQVTIPHSSVFRKFLAHISEHKSLGTIVRRLDFSHFNPTGAGMTRRERLETQNLTPKTLLHCLELLPNLREFLAQEHVDEEISEDVIRQLINLPRLHALDLCASSSRLFRDSMTEVITHEGLRQDSSIRRLSLHECAILSSKIFHSLLPRLPHLTHLDLTHTRVNDDALLSIPQSARITHLNLSKCSSLSGAAVVEFLTTHPAVKNLVYLNLLMDAKSSGVMLDEDHLTALLPSLPKTLRSLNLKGSKMCEDHLPLLLPLTKHLEELGFGRNLTYEQIASLLRAPEPVEAPESTTPSNPEPAPETDPWIPHTLHYIDISDLPSPDLDFVTLFSRHHTILKASSRPLEVIEVNPIVYTRIKDRVHVFKKSGWVVKDAGRRGWLVRDPGLGRDVQDDGGREWKMGATYWGMRKVPVARAEVGGMYGLYMFKR